MNSQIIMSEMNAHFEKLLDKFYDSIQKEILSVVHKENQSLNKDVSYQQLESQVSHIKAKLLNKEHVENVTVTEKKPEKKASDTQINAEKLDTMPRKELQALAKIHGIGGRSSNKELIRQIKEKLTIQKEDPDSDNNGKPHQEDDKDKPKKKNKKDKLHNEDKKDKQQKENKKDNPHNEEKKKDLEDLLEKSDEERKEIENSKFFSEDAPIDSDNENDITSDVDELESFGSDHDDDELVEEEYEEDD